MTKKILIFLSLLINLILIGVIISSYDKIDQLKDDIKSLEDYIDQIKSKEIKVFESYNNNFQNTIDDENEDEDKDIRRLFNERITIVSFTIGKDSVMILYPIAKMSILPWEKDEKNIWIMKIPIEDYKRNINSIVQYNFN